MTSEELEAIKDRMNKLPFGINTGDLLTSWISPTYNIAPLANDAMSLLTAVKKQQKEIAFLHNIIADLQVDALPDSQHKAALKFLANAVLKRLRDLRAEKQKEGHPVASLYFMARENHNARPEDMAMWDDQQEKLQALGSVQACNHMIDWLLVLVGLKEGERFE